MNKKEILKEESNKMRKLMGLQPINEDMLDDIINKIKDSDVVKKIEDFFDGDDDEDSDDSKNSDDKSVGDKIKDFFKSVEKDPSKTDDMISPLCGTEYEWKVTSEFGDRTRGGESEKHPANDLKAKQGTKLVSPFNGEVVDSTDNASDCGGMIKIKFDNGYEAKFCHLSSRSVEKGEFVLKGQEIGKSGGDKSDSTSKRGNSEDAHLHFELKKDGSFVDPSKHINKNYCTKA
jgi:murein DD-endopeptidase MepM/ murein hydrolase activator NlpD